jgi:hypothetical protein
MAHAKIPEANWAIARARWEGEPRCSYSTLANFLEISKQAVAKRANKDGWQKKVNMAEIVDKAHAAADRKQVREAATQGKMGGSVDAGANPVGLGRADPVIPAFVPDSRTPTAEMLATAVEDVAVNARAELLKKHRNEWPAVRNQVYKSLKGAGDVEGMKLAKVAAEALKLTQDGERKAWGVDAGGDDKPTRIVIERTEGVRVVR